MKSQILLIIYFFLIAKSFANELKTNHKIRMLQDPTDHQGNSTGTIGTPILLGFGGFNKTKLQNEDTYSFQLKVFFQKIHDYVYKKYLFLKLKLKRGYLRSLDRDGDGDINVAAKLDDDSLKRDIIVYEIDDNNNGIGHKDFDSIDVYTKMTFKDNNAKIKDFFEDCEDCDDVAIMAETENINDQKYDIDSFIFFNVLNLKTISPLHYEIIGNINIEKEINIDKNEKLTFKYQQYNNPKEFEATLSKYEEDKKIYSLDFHIKDFIETSLNGAKAHLPKNWIKIRILEDDLDHELVLNEMEEGKLYLVGSSPVPHSYSRKIASSSGLSGGAIAGIVIACVVVLIVTGLLFVYFNKPSPKNMDSSAIQFYNSSLSVVN